ncbi:MAG: hydrogenase maturation nickel metallochaperone HypA [Fibrobacter sp.]|nr:hydrogenase maturation nickel metallochaperone HypA [Fibrobacter sp.]
MAVLVFVLLFLISLFWGLVISPIFLALKKYMDFAKRSQTTLWEKVRYVVSCPVALVLLILACYVPLILDGIAEDLNLPMPKDSWHLLGYFIGFLVYLFLKRKTIISFFKDEHQKESTHDTPSELAVEIIEVGWRCRKCGTPYPYPYDRTSPMYGSPLFVCPKCGLEQADYRRLEPALDRRFGNWNTLGISIKVNVVSLLASVALLVILVNTPYADRMNIYAAMLFLTVQFFVASIIVTIESLLKKKPDFIKKSELRLQNGEYVAQLRKHGIEVPSKY